MKTIQLHSNSHGYSVVIDLYGYHIAKSGIIENNGLTIGEQKNAIEKFYTLLLTEYRDMYWCQKYSRHVLIFTPVVTHNVVHKADTYQGHNLFDSQVDPSRE